MQAGTDRTWKCAFVHVRYAVDEKCGRVDLQLIAYLMKYCYLFTDLGHTDSNYIDFSSWHG